MLHPPGAGWARWRGAGWGAELARRASLGSAEGARWQVANKKRTLVIMPGFVNYNYKRCSELHGRARRELARVIQFPDAPGRAWS